MYGLKLWVGLCLVVKTYSIPQTPDGVVDIPEDVANRKLSDIDEQSQVDLVKFTGIWYELARTQYAPEYVSVKSLIRYMELGQDRKSLIGYYTGTVNGTCFPALKGTIQQACQDEQGDFFARGITPESAWGFTKLIYTDYQTAVLYFCPEVNDNFTCRAGRQIASVWSRTKTVEPEVEIFLKETLVNNTGIPIEDLREFEYEDDCFDMIINKVKEESGNNSCVFTDIPAQSDFDIEKFEGKWYPIAAKRFVFRPELVSSPLCYHSKGDGSLSAHYISANEDTCQATDPFLLVQKCSKENTGEFMVNRGLPGLPGRTPFSLFKVVYTDYEVAFGIGCVGTDYEGACLPDFSGAAILSRTTEISAEKREFLNDIARQFCVDPTILQDVELNEKSVACGCPDYDDGDDELKSTGLSAHAFSESQIPLYESQTLKTKMLGLWYDLASLEGYFSPRVTTFTTYYYLGPHGNLHVTTTFAINGTCRPPIYSIAEPMCSDGRFGQLGINVVQRSSWYLSRMVHVDDEITISMVCEDFKSCDSPVTGKVRVAGRRPVWDDGIRGKVDQVLESLGFEFNSSTLIPSVHEADCSQHSMDFPPEGDEPSCKTKDFPVHENFTMSNIAGSWHVLAHFSHMNGSEARLSSGMVHYEEVNGYLSVFVTGTTNSDNPSCLPVLRLDVSPRCLLEDGGDMWTNEIESTFSPGAPITISATWKVIYIDEETVVVYNCKYEREDGECDVENTRVSIMARQFDISPEKRTFLWQEVSKTCIDPAGLWNMTSSTPSECLSGFNVEVEQFRS